MTSTFLGYRLYSANMTQSLQRVAAEPENASDQKYFEANIGKVTSADDFLNNYRLFTYAMNAYGLQDLGNAKALMKQVIESNLSDSNSVANRLNDSRYKSFAKAFNFTTNGSVAGSGQVQTNAQQQDMLSKMSVTTASDITKVQASVTAATSVTAFEANTGLYAQVLNAYGLDPTKTSKSDVTQALESNLSDPTSFANRTDFTSSTHYAALRAIAQDFNYASDGTTGSQDQLQSAQSIKTTQTAYLSQIPSTTASQQAGAIEGAYYAQKVPEMKSVDQLLADPRLVNYIKTAFGLDSTMTTDQLRGVLTSNLLDPKSAANTFVSSTPLSSTPSSTPSTSAPYQLLAAAFSIGTDGTAFDHSLVQTPANLAVATAAYTKAGAAAVTSIDTATVAAATTAAQTETNYFAATMPTIKSVSALLADPRLVAYIRTAYNLPAPTTVTTGSTTTTTGGTSAAALSSILTSNLLDPLSAANTSGTAARQLATAFNFAPDGLVYSQRPIQNASNVTATTTAYQAQAGTTTSAKAASQAETNYYTSTLPAVKSVDDLLGDKRIVAYLTKAYNLPTTQTSTLRQVLTSNLLDPKSKANALGGGYQTLAAAFDISSDGTITHAPDKQVQTKTGIAATHIAYLDQMMETEAGTNDGDGVRLALYFKRVAPTITSAYGILADKALTSVVQTMLGLSATSSNADIDSQAKNITNKINIADFKNPAKLDKLVARFAALYDIANPPSGSSSSVLDLFGSSSSSSSS